jgi:hypothetical protein
VSRYIADVKFIASIFPGALPSIRRNYGVTRESQGPGAQRGSLFQLDPVARGEKPFVLPVYDCFEDVEDLVGVGAAMGAGSARKPRLPKPVPVETIVEDLLRHWTGGLYNVPAGAKPGVIEISPMKVELKKWADSGYKAEALPGPNPGELDQMLSMQSRYFEYWFNEGERLAGEKKWDAIGVPHRIAAEWLGHKRTWSHGDVAKNTIPCPACQEMISSLAVVCPSCKTQIKALPAEIAALAAKVPAPTARV